MTPLPKSRSALPETISELLEQMNAAQEERLAEEQSRRALAELVLEWADGLADAILRLNLSGCVPTPNLGWYLRAIPSLAMPQIRLHYAFGPGPAWGRDPKDVVVISRNPDLIRIPRHLLYAAASALPGLTHQLTEHAREMRLDTDTALANLRKEGPR